VTRYVKIFRQANIKIRRNGAWVDDDATQAPTDTDMEAQINSWIDLAKVQVHGTEASLHRYEENPNKVTWTTLYTLTYSSEEEVKQEEIKTMETPPTNKNIPVMKGGARTSDGVKEVWLMCGVFGVPEGMRMHPEDTEAAPVPVLSPACKLSELGGLFNG